MSETTNDAQMKFAVGNTPAKPSAESVSSSPETIFKIPETTRDPRIPVKFKGDKEPTIHGVFLTKDPPGIPSQPIELHGPCVVERSGKKDSKVIELDGDTVASLKEQIMYLLTKDFKLKEEEKPQVKAAVKPQQEKPKPQEFDREKWFKDHADVVADDEWFKNHTK